MIDFEFSYYSFCDFIIDLLFIITVILLLLYILKYYFNFHFIIKKDNFNLINFIKQKKINDLNDDIYELKNDIEEDINELKFKQNKIDSLNNKNKYFYELKDDIYELKKDINDDINELKFKQNILNLINNNNIENFEENKNNENKNNENKNKNNYIERNDNEKNKKRYFLNDNIFLNDFITSKDNQVKPSTLMIDQLIDNNLLRYYSYVYPTPINDNKFIKKGYNDDDYEPPYNKYSLNPFKYEHDDLSAGLAKEADKIVLESKNSI